MFGGLGVGRRACRADALAAEFMTVTGMHDIAFDPWSSLREGAPSNSRRRAALVVRIGLLSENRHPTGLMPSGRLCRTGWSWAGVVPACSA